MLQQYPHLAAGSRNWKTYSTPPGLRAQINVARAEDGGSGSGSGFTARLLPISWLFRETLSHTLSHLHQQISIPRPQGGNWSKMRHNTTNADIKGPLHSGQEAKVTARDKTA